MQNKKRIAKFLCLGLCLTLSVGLVGCGKKKQVLPTADELITSGFSNTGSSLGVTFVIDSIGYVSDEEKKSIIKGVYEMDKDTIHLKLDELNVQDEGLKDGKIDMYMDLINTDSTSEFNIYLGVTKDSEENWLKFNLLSTLNELAPSDAADIPEIPTKFKDKDFDMSIVKKLVGSGAISNLIVSETDTNYVIDANVVFKNLIETIEAMINESNPKTLEEQTSSTSEMLNKIKEATVATKIYFNKDTKAVEYIEMDLPQLQEVEENMSSFYIEDYKCTGTFDINCDNDEIQPSEAAKSAAELELIELIQFLEDLV